MVLRKVALTGAGGLLGAHIINLFESHTITIKKIFHKKKSQSKWDLNKWKSDDKLNNLFRDCQAIIHSGFVTEKYKKNNKKYIFNSNVRACYNLANYALKYKKPIIFISGAIVYKNPYLKSIKENSKVGYNKLGADYGLSKILAENIFYLFRQKGLKIAIVRPTSIYGAGQNQKKLIAALLKKAKQNKNITMQQPINDSFNLIHANDIAQALLSILKKETWAIFNLSAKKQTRLVDIAKICLKICNSTKKIVFRKSNRTKPISIFNTDSSRAKKMLGWKQSINFEQGLRLQLQNEYQ